MRRLAAVVLMTLWAAGPAWATTPTVDDSAGGTTASGTTHTFTLPTCASGKVLLGFFTINDNQTTSNHTAGWTKITNLSGTSDTQVDNETWYRFSTGSDSFSFDTSAAATINYRIRCIGSNHATQAPEGAAESAPGASATPDPPTHTASWGTDDIMVCAYTAYDANGTAAAIDTGQANSGYPDSPSAFNVDQHDDNNASVSGNASACKAFTATATVDPDNFFLTASDRVYAGAAFIRGVTNAGPLVGSVPLKSLVNGGLVQ